VDHRSRSRDDSVGAAALPLDEHGGGIVAEVADLVVEDRVHQPAHGLGGRVSGRVFAGDEVGEPVEAEELPFPGAGLGYSVGEQQEPVTALQPFLRCRCRG